MVAPQRLYVIERDGLEVGDVLLDGAGIPRVTFGVVGERAAEGDAGEHLRLALHLCQPGERLGSHLLELVGRERGIAENLAEEPDRLRQRGPFRLHAEGERAGTAAAAATSAAATATANSDAEFVELLPELLTIVPARSRHEHRREKAAGRGEPGQ